MKDDTPLDYTARGIYKALRDNMPVQLQLKITRALLRLERLSLAGRRQHYNNAPRKARHFRRWKRHARQAIHQMGWMVIYTPYRNEDAHENTTDSHGG